MTFRLLLNGGLNLRQQLTIDKMEFSFHSAVCFPYTTTLNMGILKWLYIIFNGAKYRQGPAAPGISLVPPLIKNPEIEIRDGTFSRTQKKERKGSLKEKSP